MENQKKSMWDNMLYFGALLGGFWIFKYLFLIGEHYWVHFIYVYSLLSVVSPILMYVFYLRFRMQDPEGTQGFWKCVVFITGICFFGSLFECAIMYAHYAFINPDYFANLIAPLVGSAGEVKNYFNMPAEEFEKMKGQATEMAMSIVTSKTTYLVMNVIQEMITGFVLSLLIGALTRNRKINN